MASSTANAYSSEDCRWQYLGHGMLVGGGHSNATVLLPSPNTSQYSVGIVSCLRLGSLYTLLKSTDLSCKSHAYLLRFTPWLPFPNPLSRDDYQRALVVRYRAQSRNFRGQPHSHQTIRSQILPWPAGTFFWRWILLFSIAISQARTSSRVDSS